MSGINPEFKNTVQHRFVLAAIWQITPAAWPIKIPANKNFARLQVLLDERIPD